MTYVRSWTRRECLRWAAGATVAVPFSRHAWAAKSSSRPRVAAVITEYRHNSHADVILTKILEGWRHDGGSGPALELAGLYVDQFPENDMARDMARRHDVPIFHTIEQAITLGTPSVAVDGVLSIGEHGDYPYNDKGQHLYPRRRFFEQITAVFASRGKVVPVFNDKHLGPPWSDATWMFKRARALNVPLMAGSSIPLTFRKPDLSLPMGCPIEAAVGIGYGGLDAYGFHALEAFQALIERRQNAETGVQWVQCRQGKAMWDTIDDGTVPAGVFSAALAAAPHAREQDVRSWTGREVALFLFGYRDGFTGAVFMLPGYARGISLAVRLKGSSQSLATYFEERPEPRYPHFAYLVKAVEKMIHTGQPAYPPERTLLTGGILDRLLLSRLKDHKRIDTPELAIEYTPVDYPHAPRPDLNSDPAA